MCCHWESDPSWSELVLITSSASCSWTEWRRWTAPMTSCSSAQVVCVGCVCWVLFWELPTFLTWLNVLFVVLRLRPRAEGHPSAQRTRSESGGHSWAAAGLSGTAEPWRLPHSGHSWMFQHILLSNRWTLPLISKIKSQQLLYREAIMHHIRISLHFNIEHRHAICSLVPILYSHDWNQCPLMLET